MAYLPICTSAIPRAALSSSYSLWLHWRSSAARGVTAQVQEHFGPLVEALAGEGAGSVRNARTVGKELPAGRLARAVSEQLDLQNMWAASGTWPFFQRLHRKAHLEGQSIKSGKVSK